MINALEWFHEKVIPKGSDSTRLGHVAMRLVNFSKAKSLLDRSPGYLLDQVCENIWMYKQGIRP